MSLATDPPTIVHAAESTADDPPARALAPGTRVGRYIVREQLGSGAMGVVHAAHDPELNRRIAIKLVRRAAGSTNLDATLLREAKLMAQLADPNVVAIHDVGVFEGAVFFAMELVDGVDLRTWLATKRTVAEILRAFIDAARGLAAAHAIGLVHRDFKPANVLIAAGGRVCVGDFGIATIDREHSNDAATETSIEIGHATRTGFVMGTPAYMAPEQALGRPIDARADQFAFCVALWEAVTGARPFDAENAQDRLAKIERAELPPASPRMPTWLRRVLTRGLAFDPFHRHADMHTLVHALDRGVAPRTTRWLALAAVGGAAAIGLAAMPTKAECGGAAEIATVWNDEQRAAVRSSLGASGRPYANDVANDIARRLDTWVAQWIDARDRTCTLRGSAELDAAMSCLHRRKAALATAIEALTHADDELVVRALDVIAELPAPRECSDVQFHAVAVPEDASMRPEVESLRGELDGVIVLLDAGRFAEAHTRTTKVVDRARALAFAPLLAEALVLHGRAVASATDQSVSLPILEEAALVATASDQDATALEAWDRLAVLEATDPDRVRAATDHVRNGDALVARLGDATSRAAIGHQIAHGRVREQALDFAGALAAYRDAEARLDAADEDSERHRGAIAASLARLLQLTGDFAGAEEQGLRAEQIARARLGESHPAVAEALTQLGTIHHRRGRFPEAREAFARALAIREAAFPPTHTIVTDAITNLALLDMYTGDLPAARAALERVLEVERLRGDVFSIAQVVHNLGAVALEEDDLVEAEARTREAMALFEQALGTDDPRLCNSYETLASLVLERGALDEAETLLERSLKLWERAELTDHPGYAGALAELGRAQHLRGNHETAIDTLRRALAIYATQGIGPIFEVGTRRDLALSLWALDRRADAHTELARTRELAATIVGPEGDEIRATLAAWREEHPL